MADAEVLTTPVELYEVLQEEKREQKEGKLPVQNAGEGTTSTIDLPALGRTISVDKSLIEDLVKDGTIRRQGNQLLLLHPW